MSSKRDKYLQKKYGITEKQYKAMLRDQKQSCALCKTHKSKYSRSLAVDHNHATGKVRAAVCFYCNKFRIGKHNLKSATALYDYMIKYDGGPNESNFRIQPSGGC